MNPSLATIRDLGRAALLAIAFGLAPLPVHADTTISSNTTVDGGTLDVTAPGILTINGAGSPTLTFTNNATADGAHAVIVGSSGFGNLVINGGSTLTNDSTPTQLDRIADRYIGSGDGYIGLLNTGSIGTVTVSGAGSSWTNFFLFVGYEGSGTLNILDGGTVSTIAGYAGYVAGSTGTVTVSGAGSTLVNPTNALTIGYAGTGTMNIVDGGTVSSGHGLMGVQSSSVSTVTVSGLGSTWTNNGELYVGNYGTGTLNIRDGGKVHNSGATVGSQIGSTGTVTVSGAGSTWRSIALSVGSAGTGMLNILDGGTVSSSSGTIGFNPGSAVIVSGAGSTWTNSDTLYVGLSGTSTLTVTDGGTVFTQTLYAPGGDLQGNGEIWTNGAVLDDIPLVFDSTHGLQQTLAFGDGGQLHLNIDGTGRLGAGFKGVGSLVIAEGITVASTMGFVGSNAGSNGTVTVSGAGSTWTLSGHNTGQLYVGNIGTGTLNILDGGRVSSRETSVIGLYSGSHGTVNVSGTNSTWTNAGLLNVGGSGTASLNIFDGGTVSSAAGQVGSQSGSTGTVTVSGAGSIWTNSGVLGLGYSGGTGTLNILNGGTVSSGEGDVGVSSRGTVLVSGTNSTWNNSSELSVGFTSSGTGSLSILSGGAVTNTTGYVGRYSGSSGTVTLSGTNSTWTNSSSLYVGGSVTVADGGTLSVGGTLKLWNNGTLNLDGGTIHAGTFDFSEGTFNFTGGTLDVTGGIVADNGFTLQVANGTLVNHGAITHVVNVGSNGLVQGSGTFSVLHLDGGTVAPGHSPGTITSHETIIDSGVYQWQINQLALGTGLNPLDNAGLAGMNPGWDLWDAGVLTIGGPLTIELHSLAAGDADGALLNWDPTQDYTWLIASSTNGAFATIGGLTIDGSFFDAGFNGFNDLAGGAFSLFGDGDNLYLDFTAAAVPEPGSLLLASLAAAGFAWRNRRRLDRAPPSLACEAPT